jgi:hypothetical protein
MKVFLECICSQAASICLVTNTSAMGKKVRPVGDSSVIGSLAIALAIASGFVGFIDFVLSGHG